MKNLVRADGPPVDVDTTPYGLPSATSGDMYPRAVSPVNSKVSPRVECLASNATDRPKSYSTKDRVAVKPKFGLDVAVCHVRAEYSARVQMVQGVGELGHAS